VGKRDAIELVQPFCHLVIKEFIKLGAACVLLMIGKGFSPFAKVRQFSFMYRDGFEVFAKAL
jgi:hypothetical protein